MGVVGFCALGLLILAMLLTLCCYRMAERLHWTACPVYRGRWVQDQKERAALEAALQRIRHQPIRLRPHHVKPDSKVIIAALTFINYQLLPVDYGCVFFIKQNLTALLELNEAVEATQVSVEAAEDS